MKKALIALYCGFAARYLTSFLSLPFLGRALGPTGFGNLALMTSVVLAVAVWVEYGFSTSALREVSSADPKHRAGILIGVTVAKLALFCTAALAFALATIFVPAISHFPGNLGLVLLLGGAQALSLGWYFLGTGRATISAAMDGVSAIIWFVPAFFLVHSESDASVLIACQLAAQVFLLLIAYAIASTEITSLSIDWRHVGTQMRTGVPLCVFRLTSAIHASVIIIILGARAGQIETGYFNAADRFSGAIIAFFSPATQAIMPHLYRRSAKDGEAALFSSFRYIFVVLVFVSISAGLALYMLSNVIIMTLVGSQFSNSITVMQILSFALPFVGLAQALGLYLMLPLRLDYSFVGGVLAGEGVSEVLTFFLAPSYGAMGAAYSRLAECAVTVLVLSTVLVSKKYIKKVLPRTPATIHARRGMKRFSEFARKRFSFAFGAIG